MARILSQSMENALSFREACQNHGFHIRIVSPTIIEISTRFPAGFHPRFNRAETYSTVCLDMLPARGGSRWGSDGVFALESGNFRLCQSGVNKRFVGALTKILALEGIIAEHTRGQ